MKKLLIILLCIPMIGAGQISKETNNDEFHIYWDLVNLPVEIGQRNVITDPSFESKKIAIGSFGFESSKSFLKNNRLNYGIDFFQYKLLDKNIFQNYKWQNTTPWGTGGLHYSYYRVNGGVGAGILFTNNTSSTLNLDASGYFNQKGKAEQNISFTTFGINLNFKSNISVPGVTGKYQLKLGYYILSPKLSSNFINAGEDNDNRTQLQQDYIELPKFYISLKTIM